MTITIRQVGPCFAGEVDGIDMRQAADRQDEVAAIHAGMDKYAVLVFRDQKIDDAQQLAFTQSLGDDRACDRHQPARGQRDPPADDLRRRLQPRQEQHAVPARRPAPAVRHRQSAVALGQLVQGDAGQVLAAARHQHPVEGRQHAVRRHARGLRCARRRDQGRGRGHGVRAFADVLAPDHRLLRLHRRGARALPAGAPVHGAHPSGDGPQVALSVEHMPAASSAGRCPRRAATCAT